MCHRRVGSRGKLRCSKVAFSDWIWWIFISFLRCQKALSARTPFKQRWMQRNEGWKLCMVCGTYGTAVEKIFNGGAMICIGCLSEGTTTMSVRSKSDLSLLYKGLYPGYLRPLTRREQMTFWTASHTLWMGYLGFMFSMVLQKKRDIENA